MKPAQRGSWDPHGSIGFYVGLTLIHYQCFRCFIPTTNSERITDTITFLPQNKNPVPKTSTAENILQELRQLIKIAKTSTKPFDFIDDSEDSIKAINEIENFFTPNRRKNLRKYHNKRCLKLTSKTTYPTSTTYHYLQIYPSISLLLLKLPYHLWGCDCTLKHRCYAKCTNIKMSHNRKNIKLTRFWIIHMTIKVNNRHLIPFDNPIKRSLGTSTEQWMGKISSREW